VAVRWLQATALAAMAPGHARSTGPHASSPTDDFAVYAEQKSTCLEPITAMPMEPTISKLAAAAQLFLGDFARFAGLKGIVAVIFVTVGAVLEGASVLLIVPLLGIVLSTGSASGRLQQSVTSVFDALSIETPFWRLALLLAAFGVLMALRAVVMSIRDVTLVELQIGFVAARRSQIVGRLAASHWNQLAGLRHARFTHLMSGDIERIGSGGHFLLQCAVAGVMLLVQCVLAFVLSPMFAAIAFGLLLLVGIAMLPVMRRARDLGSFVTDANLSLLNSTTQFLGGLKLAISQNLQARFVAEFEKTLHDLATRQIAYVKQHTNGRQALATLSALFGAAAVLVGFGALNISPPVLITLLLVLTRMSGPVGQIQQAAGQLAHDLPAYEKLRALEDELGAVPRNETLGAAGARVPDGPIIFENVSFHHAHTGDSSVGCSDGHGVCNIDLTITPQEFLGITGSSGAGKSTFCDLLVGLFRPQSGQLLIGDRALDGATLVAWRANVSYVAQDPFLFHDTIRRNLSWVSPQAAEEELWAALTIAGADVLVRRMKEGLDTMVGERGTLVSGGERQRIALARAVLRRPRLLILDEATSAIDIAGEREVIDRVRKIRPRPTIVMIAHRPERLCDRVMRMEAGRFVFDPGHGEFSVRSPVHGLFFFASWPANFIDGNLVLQ
jgi:ATP-binding cassette subfamily C protein